MASSNFLDYVGLTRFKEKLLELVDKKLADKQPVGDYLSASVESSLVHKTGNETIAGTKTFSSTISGNVSGNAGTATKLQNAKTIALSGAVTGTATSFDGSQNITISTTSVDASKVSGTVASAAIANSVAWGNVSSKPESYTPSAHNQASNTITAMTSYAKASSSANIATTDSLNTAIGKLEYKIDANTSSIGKKANTSDLAAVATSGSYSDLSNKPTSLKNPSSLTIQNSAGTSIGSYDGSSATSVKLTASTVGLGNVTNQSKATMFTSPAFTGTPTAPTAAAGTNSTQLATTAFVTTAIANKTSVASATKATQDASGNVITSTYATKSEMSNAVKVTASGDGYRAFSDGRIEQWGKAKIANGSGTKIAFPIAFPNAIESFVCTPIGKAVSYGVEPDSSLGGATITHNGNGGVEMYYRVIGS